MPDPLELEPEVMRRLGYRVVDRLVERIAGLDEGPAWQGAARPEVERLAREPPPEEPADVEALIEQVFSELLPPGSTNDHPRFFAFIPSSPTWPAVLGGMIATGANPFQGMWYAAPALTGIELAVLDWFKAWLGYPPKAGGLFTSGGSHASLTALACAREALLGAGADGAVVYASTHVHSSVTRALRVLGLDDSQVRLLPTDERFRLPAALLAEAIAADERAGRRPLAVVANGGATSTGAIDPLPALADICADRGVWLHVDAAYGGFAVLTGRGRQALEGIERADSIALDPHKWLFAPYEAGCLLVRDVTLLERAFALTADYLQDNVARTGEVNFSDRGLELTRPARALKVWLSLKAFGLEAFRVAIDGALDLALTAEERVRRSPHLDLLSPATLGVVCFRRRVDGGGEDALEEVNARLVERLKESGEGMISSTRLDGRYALRLCILNHRSGKEDVERVLGFLERAPVDV